MKSRKRLFLAVVAVAVAFGASGYLLGQQLESPEDARSEVSAPDPSLIAVPVESTALSNDVVLGGNGEFEGAVDLQLDPSLGDGATRIVTGRVPDVDTEVNEGDIVIEVSTRPVFILEGALPAFREFKPGVEGDDVLQLETALQRLGFLDVEPDRLFGQATEAAIAAMYEEAGYEARSASVVEETQIEVAEKAVESARTALADANDGLSDLLSPPSQAEQVRDAQSRQGLVDRIADAQEALDEITADRPSNQVIQAFDGLQAAEIAGQGVDEANQAVRAAQDAEQAQIDGAQDAVDDAQAALNWYDELQAAADRDGTNTTNAQRAIDDSADRLEDAEADLAELEEDIGVRLPVAEVVFLPNLPRTVTSIDVERGDPVTAFSVMRISGTEVRITTGVSDTNRPLLEVGQRVIIDSEDLDIEVEGEITELADRKGTNGAADTRYYMQVTPTGEYNVSQLIGVFFRLQVPLERTDGDVLAVPLAAVSPDADGGSTVRVERSDGSTDMVQVEVGLKDRNGSLVEVTPVAGSLAEGDLVVIEIDQSAAAASPQDDADESEADGADDSEAGDADDSEVDDEEAGG